MTPDDCAKAVSTMQRVKIKSASPMIPEPHAEGRVLAYSIVPMVLIETDEGERIWWRHDLAEPSA